METISYYNEFNPKMASWIKELIHMKAIPNGDVDERSIREVSPSDLKGYTQCHFFAGIGGWSLALERAGIPSTFPLFTGSCPCFVAGTLVLTQRGQINIEEVVPGDFVLTHTGRFCKVLNVQRSLKETIIIKGQGLNEIETTAEHPFYAKKSSIDYHRKSYTCCQKVFKTPPQWVEAQFLKGYHWANVRKVPKMNIPPIPVINGEDTGLSFVSGKWKIRISLKGKSIYLGSYKEKEEAKRIREEYILKNGNRKHYNNVPADRYSIEFAFFLGYWIGDGWTTEKSKNKGRVFICGSRKDGDFLINIAKKAGLSGSLSSARTGMRYCIRSKTLCKWLNEEFGAGASTKKIPSWIFGQDNLFKKSFLDGLLAADGCDDLKNGNKIGVSLSTTSKNIAIGTRILFNQLGMSCTMSKVHPHRQCIIENRLVHEKDLYKVRGGYSIKCFRFDEQYGWGLVRSVNKTGIIKPVFNLQVEGDNSYVADGIIVHNCQSFSTAGRQSGFEDERDLWPVFFNLIKECKPELVFGEQVKNAVKFGWLDRLHADLETAGYAVGNAVLGAHSSGAPHIRQRIYWVADSGRGQCQQFKRAQGNVFFGPSDDGTDGGMSDPEHVGCDKQTRIATFEDCDESEKRLSFGNGSDCGLAHAEDDGKRSQHGKPFEGLRQEEQAGRRSVSHGKNFWSNAIPNLCRDGKYRFFEPSIYPLAHVFPLGLGSGSNNGIKGIPSEEETNQKGEARVMRLSGYGNAICVETAKIFIEEVFNSMQDIIRER